VDTLLERVPPQNTEAEQAVLGSMLIEKEAILTAAEALAPEDFYREAHAKIFSAIVTLTDRNEPVDLVTLTDELTRTNQIDSVGGVAYISTLANAVPTAANVDYYARIVEEKSILRRLIRASAQVAKLAYDGQDSAEAVLDQSEQLVFAIGQRRKRRSYEALSEVLKTAFEHIERLYHHKGSVIGVPTGFRQLDELTSGLHPSEFIILAARPSMGKTTLGLNIAASAALRHDVPSLVFSLEMAREQLAIRLLCSEAGIDQHRLRTGYLREDDWPKLSTALGQLSEAPIFIDDTPGISIVDLRSRARRLRAEKNIGLVVVDYLQLLQTRGRSENRQQEISEISRSLKALARELQCPVLAMSQLSRAVEQRTDRRPQLSDLRESGAIEQDADVVAFIWNNPERENENLMEIIVAKQRNGPTDTVPLVFLKRYARFVDPSWRSEGESPQG